MITMAKEHEYYRKLERSNDFCDRCGVPAAFRVVKLDEKVLELLLCGHHFKVNSYDLGLGGWLIQSEIEEK